MLCVLGFFDMWGLCSLPPAKVEDARKVSRGLAKRSCGDGQVVEFKRMGFKISQDYALMTPAQMRDCNQGSLPPKSLVPMIDIPTATGKVDAMYAVRDEQQPAKRLTVFAEFSVNSESTLLKADDLLCPRHLETKFAAESLQQVNSDQWRLLFGKVPSMSDIANAASSSGLRRGTSSRNLVAQKGKGTSGAAGGCVHMCGIARRGMLPEPRWHLDHMMLFRSRELVLKRVCWLVPYISESDPCPVPI